MRPRAVLLAIAIGGAAWVPRVAAFELAVPQRPVAQGDVFVVALRQLPEGARVDGWWRGAPIAFAPGAEGESLALVGVDLATRPGRYLLTLGIAPPQGRPIRRRCVIVVARRRFSVQRLTLPAEMAEPDAQALVQIQREIADFAALWPQRTPERLWRGAFAAPVPGALRSSFGLARFINGERRAPHSGVDVQAEMGEPVRAINGGRAVLVGDYLMSGMAVVLDHGQGLFSMYFHLSEIRVAQGELVAPGQVLGLAGSTGRSTGPHLHWGVRLDKARVDPFSLIAATESLAPAATSTVTPAVPSAN